MKTPSIDRYRMRMLSAQCHRLEMDIAAIYHRACQVKMPLETLSVLAKMAADVHAIHTRLLLYALRHPTGGQS